MDSDTASSMNPQVFTISKSASWGLFVSFSPEFVEPREPRATSVSMVFLGQPRLMAKTFIMKKEQGKRKR